MFGVISLEEISGGSFFEVLRNLILKCVPDGEKLLESLDHSMGLFLLLGLVLGIFQCFLGYAARRVWTALLLLALCGYGGALAAEHFLLPMEGFVAVTAIAGSVGGLAGYFFPEIGAFLRPLFIIFISAFAIFTANGLRSPGIIVGLSAGLIFGIAAAVFSRVGLMLYTSLFGGLLAGICVAEAFSVPGEYAPLVIGGMFAITGFGIQLFAGGNLGDELEKTDSAKEAAKRLKAATQIDTAAQLAAAEEENLKEANTSDSGEGKESAESAIPGAEKVTESDFARPQQEQGEEVPPQIKIDDTPAGTCPSCGTPYSARAKYCMQCGHKL